MKNIKGYTEHLSESSEGSVALGKRLLKYLKDIDLSVSASAVWGSGKARPEIDQVRRLVQNGAELNVRDDEGWTPLHWAAFMGSPDAVRILLEAGADIDAMEGNGYTPLWVATLMRRGKPAAKELILRGANLGAFADLEALEETFDGDISWLPQELLPEEWRKARRSRSAFGRF